MLIYQRVVKGVSEETLYIFINQSMGIWDIYGRFDLSADSNQGQPPARYPKTSTHALHSSDGFKNVLSPHCCLSRGFPSPSKFLRKSSPNHQQIQVYLDTISESWETYRKRKTDQLKMICIIIFAINTL
jgi:hypothetical protein